MKSKLVVLSLVLLTLSCNKIKEQIQEDIVLKAMTDGQWHMTKFIQAAVDKTADFAPYLFQFKSNNSVDAINNGTTERTGSWSADPAARTITSTFPTTTAPLGLLNGTWKITSNGWTYVEATQTVNGEVLLLRLEK